MYEHLAVIPQWSAAPPESLAMFQGEYGLNAEAFWTRIHPITIALCLLTLILFWKTAARKNILILLLGYVSVMVVTFIYFVPELIDITQTEFNSVVDDSLRSRAQLWETLSLLRLIVIIILAIIFSLGLTKTDLKNQSNKELIS